MKVACLWLGVISTSFSLLQAAQTPSSASFQLKDGLIWVHVATPRSAAQLNFLLDSGASVSVLNLSTMERSNLPRGRSVRVKGLESAARGYWPQRLLATAGNISLPTQFLGVDLSELSRASIRERRIPLL